MIHSSFQKLYEQQLAYQRAMSLEDPFASCQRAADALLRSPNFLMYQARRHRAVSPRFWSSMLLAQKSEASSMCHYPVLPQPWVSLPWMQAIQQYPEHMVWLGKAWGRAKDFSRICQLQLGRERAFYYLPAKSKLGGIYTLPPWGVWAPYRLIVIGAEAKVSIVEEGAAADSGWGVTEFVLYPGAQLTHYIVGEDMPRSYSIAVYQMEQSDYHSLHLGSGSTPQYQQHSVLLGGVKASARLEGGYVVEKGGYRGYRSHILHDAPETKSAQYYKGVVAGRGSFIGSVEVSKRGRGSEAYQQHDGLLVGGSTWVEPQLQIDIDEVQCSHGATSRTLDPDQLHYLRLRGLSKEAGEKLLAIGFLQELLQKSGIEESYLSRMKHAVSSLWPLADRRSRGG